MARALLSIGVAAGAALAAPQGELLTELARMRAALVDVPVRPASGSLPLRIVHWRTGRPLPDAIVVELHQAMVPDLPIFSSRTVQTLQRQKAWLHAAARAGTRLRLDADGRSTLRGSGWAAVVVHEDDFAVVTGCCAAPCPLLPLVVEVVDAADRPRPDVSVSCSCGSEITDAKGRAVLWLDDTLLTTVRHVMISADFNHVNDSWMPVVLAAGTAVVDTRDARALGEVVHLKLPPTGHVEVRAMFAGKAAEHGLLRVGWCLPFSQSPAFRLRSSGTTSLFTHLPAGVPVAVAQPGENPVWTTPRAGETVQLELPLRQPFRGIRYRLRDAQGRVPRGGPAGESMFLYDPDRDEVVFPASDKPVFVRLFAEDGEEWSCARFRLPSVDAPGILDGGVLVLEPSSTTPYCSGLVIDTEGQPVSTNVQLTNGHGIWTSTYSDTEGRFELRIGPWFTGPMGLGVRALHCLTEVQAARGDRGLVLVVDTTRSVSACVEGQVLGLEDGVPIWPPLHVRVTGSDTGAENTTQLGADGRFAMPVRPGTYDVRVSLPDGTLVLAADGVVVPDGTSVSPPVLRGPLPSSHRAAVLHVVDGEGLPSRLPLRGVDATGSLRVVVPSGGGEVNLPALGRVTVSGDRTLVYAPVKLPVRVRGLPKDSPWHFGLRIVHDDALGPGTPGWLVDGRTVVFLNPGLTVRVEVVAQRCDARGAWTPAVPVVLQGIGATLAVPALVGGELLLDAPANLAAQLEGAAEDKR